MKVEPDFLLQEMVPSHQYFLLLLILIIPPSSSSHCNRFCRDHQVPYPFGFSQGCEIRLDCTNGSIHIEQFQVNVTETSILVNLPPKCNRSINTLTPLFGPNYAPTWQNGLLLHNCSSVPVGCVIPRGLLKSQFLNACEEPSCYSKDNSSELMKFSDVEGSSCGLVFSSVAVDAVDDNKSMVALEFQTVKLGWWLEGKCNCSANATCIKVISPVSRRKGFRCQCVNGFVGDGFQAGSGCWTRDSPDCSSSKYFTGQCGGATRIGVLTGGVIAGACLVTGLAFFCYLVRRRNISCRTRETTKKLLSEAAGSLTLTVPFYTYKEIEKATYCFCEKFRLGTGAYGTVYAGKLHNDEWVAIKKIRYRDRDGIEPIINEIKLISSVSHPNLVHLLGFCLEKGEQILIYEYMPNGTLSQHLQRERGTGLPWTIRLNIATETAHAIAHLHSAIDPPIYHRDIKSSNILLDCNFNSKVADFGLSRIGTPESSHISTAPQGTPGYLDPQYHQNFHLSDKSDVYSFGVVLVEIITAMKVVDFSRPQSDVNLAAVAIDKIGKGCLNEIIDPFLEPHKDVWTFASIHKTAELAFRCLAFHRDMRPSMKEVAAELEQIKLSGWAPLEENIICAPLSVTSCYSSSSNGSKKSQKKEAMLEKRALERQITVSAEVKDWSPVSVDGPWLSEQSSPSTNSFLSNGIH